MIISHLAIGFRTLPIKVVLFLIFIKKKGWLIEKQIILIGTITSTTG